MHMIAMMLVVLLFGCSNSSKYSDRKLDVAENRSSSRSDSNVFENEKCETVAGPPIKFHTTRLVESELCENNKRECNYKVQNNTLIAYCTADSKSDCDEKDLWKSSRPELEFANNINYKSSNIKMSLNKGKWVTVSCVYW